MPSDSQGSKELPMVDGQLSWEGGVDSAKVKTISSSSYPKGLGRNKLAWLINGTVRSGAIGQRTGWQPLIQGAPWDGVGIFQGASMHHPDNADPHILLSIGGQIFRANVDTDNSVDNLSAIFGLSNPPDEPQVFFRQTEMFTVIQAGDYLSGTPTNPLFYQVEVAPTFLRRSNGFVGAGDPGNEIPPAGPMDYHGNRLWYGFGRFWGAGDIAGGTAGTAPFAKRDAVLHNTENPLVKGGDNFIIPSGVGNIRAISHTANLDTALGESPLFIFTREAVFLADPPLTRSTWSDPANKDFPIQRVGLIKGGTYAERAVVPVNGDLFFPSTPNGDIKAFSMSLRYFQQWGNIPISRNENRILQFNDRSLLRYASGIEFDNRLWQTVLPFETPLGVAFQGVMPLDFDIISSLDEREPPAWEGVYEGLYIMQLLRGDFGGRERAFAVVYSRNSGNIEIWELTNDNRFENGENRVTWVIEFPAYTWGDPLKLKRLIGGSIWLDKILGTVDIQLQYRPNQWPCWIDWQRWTECTAKDCREDPFAESCYPQEIQQYCESFMPDRDFIEPPKQCIGANKKPSNIGYQFQARLVIRGWCRVRGFILKALPIMRSTYDNLPC